MYLHGYSVFKRPQQNGEISAGARAAGTVRSPTGIPLPPSLSLAAPVPQYERPAPLPQPSSYGESAPKLSPVASVTAPAPVLTTGPLNAATAVYSADNVAPTISQTAQTRTPQIMNLSVPSGGTALAPPVASPLVQSNALEADASDGSEMAPATAPPAGASKLPLILGVGALAYFLMKGKR